MTQHAQSVEAGKTAKSDGGIYAKSKAGLGGIPLYRFIHEHGIQIPEKEQWNRACTLAISLCAASCAAVIEFQANKITVCGSVGVWEATHPDEWTIPAAVAEFFQAQTSLCEIERPEDAGVGVGDWLCKLGICSLLCAPLRDHTQTLRGVLVAFGREPRAWSETQRNALEDIAKLAEEILLCRRTDAYSAFTRRPWLITLLNEVASLLLNPPSEGQLVPAIFEIIAPDLGLDAYFHYICDPSGRMITLNSHAGVPEDLLSGIRQLEVGQGLCGMTAERREPIVLEELQFSDWEPARWMRELGMHSYACSPLFAGDVLVGTLAFASAQRDRFEPDELEFMDVVCHYVALAMDRGQRSTALQRSEKFIQAVLDSLPAVVVVLDDRGRVVTVNQQWLRFAEENGGVADRERVLGSDYLAVTERAADQGDEYAVKALDGIKQVLSGQADTFTLEYPCHSPSDERWFVMQVEKPHSSMIGGVVITHWLTTERKRAEDALRESEARFRQIAEAIDYVFWVSEPEPNERVLYASPAFEKIWQRPLEALYASKQAWRNAIHPEDSERVLEQYRTCLADPEARQCELEYRIVRPDHSVRWIRDTINAIRHPDGRVRRLTGVAEDITARKEAEAKLWEAKEAAEAASRAKDDFLAALSHELRTPLNPVLLLVSALEDSPGTQEMFRRDLAAIRRNIEVEARLIDDLLDLTRISCGKVHFEPRFVDVHRLIHYTIEMLQAELAEKNITPELDFQARDAVVQADPVRLQQVFWNVLKNAVKFSPSGGAVVICTNVNPHATLHLAFTDSGIGIRQENLNSIFEAFRQTDQGRRFGGLGLGLAISRKLIELQGGRIFAESNGLGKGATFHIELPLAAEFA